nr:phospholipase-like protein [Tanacetum cinerariifolium]
MKLFKDTVFGKYLDLDVEDNDNYLLNYVLHHQRPQLSKSIDSNLVFDIARHTLLFRRSEFCLVTDFACGKLVFPKYMDDDVPPFLRCLFLEKATNLENKASLGKAAQGKAAKRASARAKVEETKSTREVAHKEELELWKSRYIELESYYKNLEASVEIARKNSLGLSFPTPNVKAMSVYDDIDEADTVVDDNANAMSVCDDINESNAVSDDNAKATSVHDDVGVPDAAAADITKVPIFDDYNTPVDNENVLMKDAHEFINHTDPPIYGFQIMLWSGLEKKGDDLDEAKANQKDTEPEVTAVKKPERRG